MLENYKYLIVPLVTLVLCQILKFVIESLFKRKLLWERLFNGSGGMPSTHTSFSCSLLMMIGLNIGFDSPFFAICLVFSLIVIYDAMGLRMESGMHAAAINQIFDEFYSNKNRKKLKEQLGHRPLEVLAGIILGIVLPLFFTYVIF